MCNQQSWDPSYFLLISFVKSKITFGNILYYIFAKDTENLYGLSHCIGPISHIALLPQLAYLQTYFALLSSTCNVMTRV